MSAPDETPLRSRIGSADAWRAKGRGRLRALVALGVLVGAGAWLGTLGARPAPSTHVPSAALAADAAPAGSQSESWYCPSVPSASVPGVSSRLVLVGSGGRPVHATLTAVGAGGRARRARASVTVPGAGEVSIRAPHVGASAWEADRVDVTGGAVVASALVTGPRGRGIAPCASETSPVWYFASGSTSGGSALHVSLFNPTPDLAVVDLTFVSTSGVTSPMPFQGIVVAPMAVVTKTVGTYVQNKGTVATVVRARSGSVVAGELQLFGRQGTSGVGLTLGTPVPSPTWVLPRTVDALHGTSSVVVFNPTPDAERVRVDVRIAGGPVAPFSAVVGPDALWQLATSDELRIPQGSPYAATIHASGGVVVARIGSGAPSTPTSQWAQAVAVPLATSGEPVDWILPAAASPSGSEVVGIDNPAARPALVRVVELHGRTRRAQTTTVEAGSFTSVAVHGPALISADAPVVLAGDASATGAAGVVEVPAVPSS